MEMVKAFFLQYWGDAYSVATQLLLAVGLWKIFVKCGEKGWWALIPGLYYFKLGDCARRETEGKICVILQILLMGFTILNRIYEENQDISALLALAALVLFLVMAIFEIRIYSGLCRTFGLRKRWIFLWVCFSWLPAVLWGFRQKYQPLYLKRDDDDDRLAGTRPAEIASYAPETDDEEDSDGSGLYVDLKERVARDFLKRRYLLKDIRLAIPNGSLVLLLGGSGSGKTTFINAVIGYEKSRAKMVLNGKDIYRDYAQMKYRIGLVPQQDLLRLNDTAEHTLTDAASLRLPVSVSSKEAEERVDSVMDTLGISAGKNGLVSKKSGGQKKRISIGMELISDPDLFVLDEPDSGLDGVIARELFTKLREVADAGNIVITITHTPDRVVEFFDKVIVLARDSGRVGRLAYYGSPENARRFFGKNSMEEIVMAINRKNEGGEGRADEFIDKYAKERAAGHITLTGEVKVEGGVQA